MSGAAEVNIEDQRALPIRFVVDPDGRRRICVTALNVTSRPIQNLSLHLMAVTEPKPGDVWGGYLRMAAIDRAVEGKLGDLRFGDLAPGRQRMKCGALWHPFSTPLADVARTWLVQWGPEGSAGSQ